MVLIAMPSGSRLAEGRGGALRFTAGIDWNPQACGMLCRNIGMQTKAYISIGNFVFWSPQQLRQARDTCRDPARFVRGSALSGQPNASGQVLETAAFSSTLGAAFFGHSGASTI